LSEPIGCESRTVGDEARIPTLDGLRGLAILIVMLSHFSSRLDAHDPIQNLIRSPFKNFGWTGVDLFFVLSGFLITGILLDTRSAQNDFSAFYARRVLRIFPLYYFSLLVIFFALMPAFRIHLSHPGARIWYVIYAQNWIKWGSVPPAEHFWSLAVEEQFYLAWPLIVYNSSQRRLLRISLTGIVIAIALRFAFLLGPVDHRIAYINTFTRMDALLAGAACACLLRERDCGDFLRRHARWFWALPIAALFVMKFSPKIGSGFPPIRSIAYPFVPISYAAFLMGAVVDAGAALRFQRVLRASFMRTAGKYSYAAYVWHQHTAHLVYVAEKKAFGNALPQLLNIPILVGATWLVCMASYVLIERPFLRLKRHFQANFKVSAASV
jgi:peptidoglycan/LPS O-acetylase OafA/YrhL